MKSKIVIICLSIAVSFFYLNLSNTFAVNTAQIFESNCDMCHGPDGKGTKQGITFGVPNFTDKEWQATRTDENFVNSITNGKEENPNYISFGGRLTEDEINAMAQHMRKFAQ